MLYTIRFSEKQLNLWFLSSYKEGRKTYGSDDIIGLSGSMQELPDLTGSPSARRRRGQFSRRIRIGSRPVKRATSFASRCEPLQRAFSLYEGYSRKRRRIPSVCPSVRLFATAVSRTARYNRAASASNLELLPRIIPSKERGIRRRQPALADLSDSERKRERKRIVCGKSLERAERATCQRYQNAKKKLDRILLQRRKHVDFFFIINSKIKDYSKT